MKSEEEKLFNKVGKDKYFNSIISKVTTTGLTYEEKVYVLACSILLLNQYKIDNRYTSYAEFAYYIVLQYSLKNSDYKPLYNFSVNFGFYPIAKAILEKELVKNYQIEDCFIDIGLDKFKGDKNEIKTLEQYTESKKFLIDKSHEKSYIAPTSFGKSSLIVDNIISYQERDFKIAIIVPTKSLLVQTYQMVKNANLKKKIIIHDEMYNDERSFIAIFTQERALRLLNRKKIYFDVLFIDEAHNIFKNDSRSILLARLIARNRILNVNQKVIYLSPLIENSDNLKIIKEQKINSYNIKFNIKESEIFEYRLDNNIYKYNRFINQFDLIGQGADKFNYLKENEKSKNFLYNLRPVKIEMLAKDLCEFLPQLEKDIRLLELEEVLKKEVHNDFYLVKYIKYGLIYLHGKLPDLIKEYLENKFKNLDKLKYVIANSVILEGMNLPIDCLFIFNTRLLKEKDLMNLIGRVNRLNNIFSSVNTDLTKLLPNVHFINSERYNSTKGKMQNQIKLLRSHIFNDIIENPILNSFDFDKLKIPEGKKEKEKIKIKSIQDNEKFLLSLNSTEKDKIKKYLIETGIDYCYNNTDMLTDRLLKLITIIKNNGVAEWGEMRMLDKIDYLFIQDIDSTISDYEFQRLKNEKARNYYENHILIAQKRSLNQNINSEFEYFKAKAKSNNAKLYIGDSYGEVPYESGAYSKSHHPVYIDLAEKSDEVLINIAVVKLKMEDDFVSFKLNKFIVMMYDYNLISKDEYNLYIYGTTDTHQIELTKYGLSVSLITRLGKANQLKNLTFDEFNNLKGNEEFEKFKNSIDDFYRFEISRYLN